MRACQFVAGAWPQKAGFPWIAGRGRRVWRGDARGWLADRPLLRQTLGATFQPALAPACPARAGRESVPTWFQLTAWFPWLIPIGGGSPIPVDIPDDSSLGMGGNGMVKGISAVTP